MGSGRLRNGQPAPLKRIMLAAPGEAATEIECSRCRVRDWTLDDRADLVRYADNRKIWRNMSHQFPYPYTEADADDWFARLAAIPDSTHWAIELKGRAAGGIGVALREGVFSRSAELGYWLGEPFWGRGLMTEVVQAVIPYAMSHFALCRLEAPVFAWNPASMRVLEHCGFECEGVSRASVFKDGELIDRVVYALVDRAGG